MATEVVQFRFDPDGLEFLRRQGLNPNQFAKESFASAVRRMRAQATLERLRELAPHGVDWGGPAEDVIRRMRDERAAEIERR